MSEAIQPILLIFIALAMCSTAFAAEGETNLPLRGAIPDASSVPVSVPPETPKPVLRDTIEKNSAAAAQGSSVESFFEIGPKKNDSARRSSMSPAVEVISDDKKKKSLPHHLYGFFWHVLDNAGVPMFIGHDSDLDPSLGAKYLIPSPVLPRESNVAKEVEKGASVSDQSPPPPAPAMSPSAQQKIPASELEGTIYESPATHDVQNTAR